MPCEVNYVKRKTNPGRTRLAGISQTVTGSAVSTELFSVTGAHCHNQTPTTATFRHRAKYRLPFANADLQQLH